MADADLPMSQNALQKGLKFTPCAGSGTVVKAQGAYDP